MSQRLSAGRRTPGLINAVRTGGVTLASAVGNGVADDKLLYTCTSCRRSKSDPARRSRCVHTTSTRSGGAGPSRRSSPLQPRPVGPRTSTLSPTRGDASQLLDDVRVDQLVHRAHDLLRPARLTPPAPRSRPTDRAVDSDGRHGPAVDHVLRTHDRRGSIRDQEADQVGDLLGAREPAQRDPAGESKMLCLASSRVIPLPSAMVSTKFS